MCTPTAGLAMQASGAATSAIGSYYSAQAQKAAYGAQGAFADANAEIDNTLSQQALFVGQQQQQQVMLRTAQMKSDQRAQMAANGVDLGVGSANNVLTSTDYMGQVDANTVKANTARTAWGYQAQGASAGANASYLRGIGASINPMMNATSSLLTGAGKVADRWYSLYKSGAIPDSSLWSPKNKMWN